MDAFLQAMGGLTRWVKEAKMRAAASRGAPTVVGLGGQHVADDEAYDEEGGEKALVPDIDVRHRYFST